MHFFTADQHYGHANIIRFCDRPFSSVEEMDRELIRRHNEVVGPDDTVIHAGDFAYRNTRAPRATSRSSTATTSWSAAAAGWLDVTAREILELEIEGQPLVVCHYAMRTWPRSHYGSWQLHGHSHGSLEPQGKQWDVGVDQNDFTPVSFTQLKEIMAGRPDNAGLVTGGSDGQGRLRGGPAT